MLTVLLKKVKFFIEENAKQCYTVQKYPVRNEALKQE